MKVDASPAHLIRNARLVTPAHVVTGDLMVRDGRIAAMGASLDADGAHVLDADGGYVVPGFIDLHCHGGRGLDLTEGRFDPRTNAFDDSPERYAEDLPRLMRAFAGHGTTRVLLATIAAPEERLATALGHLAEYVLSDRNGRDGARCDGAFIEGTFIRRPEFAGAQNAAFFREPSVDLIERLNGAARGTVRYVNVAPEWGEAGLALIRELRRRSILVGAGHTGATAEQYHEAVRAGLQVAVHFTNGPTGTSFKPFGGGSVFQAVLRSRSVYAELICDGYHVNPAYVRDIIWRKGVDRIVAVTDAMFLTDLPGADRFVVGGVKGRVAASGRYLVVEGKPNTLFGSVARMSDAFGQLLSWLTTPMHGVWVDEHPAMSTEAALVAAAQMCAGNAARLLGLDQSADGHAAGTLEVGKRADLALLQGDYAVEVQDTFVGGRRIEHGPTSPSPLVGEGRDGGIGGRSSHLHPDPPPSRGRGNEPC
jgi:N-acetylglucosamine-6-phosphate deacetylase